MNLPNSQWQTYETYARSLLEKWVTKRQGYPWLLTLSSLGIDEMNNVVDTLNQHDLVHASEGISHPSWQTYHVMLARWHYVHAAQKQSLIQPSKQNSEYFSNL